MQLSFEKVPEYQTVDYTSRSLFLLRVYLPLVRVRVEPICGCSENAQGERDVANMSKLSKA